MSEDQDWRLKVELDADDRRGTLDRLLGRLRDPNVVGQIGGAVPPDVAVTHDGSLLFAYAPSEASLALARRAIEELLGGEGVKVSVCVSHWDERVDEWLQVDPPLTGAAKRTEEAIERAGEKLESRTMIASTGRMIRSQVEQTMREWAERLGLECELIEHPHLLTTQVAFTVTGPRRRIDEFAAGLRAEELATMRTEGAVMLSPL